MLYPSNLLLSVCVAFFLAGAIALFAVRARALTVSGGIAACVVGASILGFGGWLWGGALMTFFLTSTILGRVLKRLRKPTSRHNIDTDYVEPEKGGRRDAMQVLANGGVAALCAICHGVCALKSGRPEHLFMVLFLAALATANGDTWATEIGSAIGGEPRLITNGKAVPSGTSGAVTPVGFIASVLGAALLAAFALHLDVYAAATIWGCGVSGVLIDSLLGATLQAQAMDSATGLYVEKLAPGVRPDRGISWIRNDQVNALSIICSALLALWLYSKI